MIRAIRRLLKCSSGAVAPTVALSLFGLIAAGGIAFDYARVASMDTELQDAADQSALAAASQLDGQAGSCKRAVAAARELLTNQTLLANDGGARAVAIADPGICNGDGTITDNTGDPNASIRFYKSYDRATDTPGDPADDDTNAKIVIVSVTPREAFYALTPIVAAFRSGNIGAQAVASLGSAICKVPPVMICNPDEPEGNTNPDLDFNPASYVGRGLRLISVGNGNTAWGPGDFGYLNTGSDTSNPNVELRQALGWTAAPGDCSPLDGVQTRTGAGTTVTQALNTRFDIYEKPNTGNGNNGSCPLGGSCPPSINTVKDVVRRNAPSNANQCGVPQNGNEWVLPTKRYLPTTVADVDLSNPANVPDAMGYPRDECHAVSQNGSCADGKIGDGVWDRNAYFYVNYGWTAAQWPGYLNSGVSSARIPTTAAPTRYQVYLWEIANRGSVIGGKTILGTRSFGSGANSANDYDSPVCSPLQSPSTTGVVPGGGNVDRRRISAAVINCNAEDVHGGGNTVYPVIRWIELFLVEPSLQRDRTDPNDVYVEIIGETSSGATGGTAGQVVRRDVPYLIK
jgi:Flp pilus assembly protein TadG